ncbi:MAG: DUF4446 family protein [Armatimonadota bacterium]
MGLFAEFVGKNQVQATLALAAAVLVLAAALVANAWGLYRVRRRYSVLLKGASGEDLEETLKRFADAAVEARTRAEKVDERLSTLVQQVQCCAQRFGFVRFDAFETVSGRQSFSLALLDANGNGVVITTLYGRDSCRVYGKLVKEGNAEALTDEEKQAIALAMGKGIS